MVTKKQIKTWITIAITILTAIATALAASQCTMNVYGFHVKDSDSTTTIDVDSSKTVIEPTSTNSINGGTKVLWTLPFMAMYRAKKRREKYQKHLGEVVKVGEDIEIHRVKNHIFALLLDKKHQTWKITLGHALGCAEAYKSKWDALERILKIDEALTMTLAQIIINETKKENKNE